MIIIILAQRLTQSNQWVGVDHVYIYINKKHIFMLIKQHY